MSLKDKLRSDVTVALKARDQLTVTALRSVIGAVDSAEKGGKTPVVFDDAAVLQTIRKQIKQRHESAEAYETAKRPDHAELERAEAAILSAYVPADLTDTELAALVERAIGDFPSVTQKDFGALMRIVVASAAGCADGKRISAAVKARI